MGSAVKFDLVTGAYSTTALDKSTRLASTEQTHLHWWFMTVRHRREHSDVQFAYKVTFLSQPLEDCTAVQTEHQSTVRRAGRYGLKIIAWYFSAIYRYTAYQGSTNILIRQYYWPILAYCRYICIYLFQDSLKEEIMYLNGTFLVK